MSNTRANRTKSPFPVRNPDDPEDASVQVMIRVPFWYYQRIQKIDKTKSVSAITLDLLGRHVSQDKRRARLAPPVLVMSTKPWHLCDKCFEPIHPDAPWFVRYLHGNNFQESTYCVFCELRARGVEIDKANEINLRWERIAKMEASLRGDE